MRIIDTFEELVAFVKEVSDWAIKIAIAYIRVSTREQADEGYSLDAQKKYLCRYAEALQINVVFFFLDQESAKAPGRTEFMKMVDFFNKFGTPGKCPFLLVEKTDRLTRNKQDDNIIDELVAKCGLHVHYVKDSHIQSPDSKASDNFVQSIRVAVAKFYIENLAEEAAKGMKAKAELGIYPSCAPIGYLNTIAPDGRKILKPDPTRGPLVKLIFDLYVYDHKSINDILKIMKKHGLNSPRGKSLVSRNTIELILHRPLYAGYFYWNGVRYNGSHEPLVSTGMFNRAQVLLEQKAPYKGSPKARKKEFTFTGALTCGICGYAMIGELKKGKYVYYHCTGNGDPNCPNKRVYTRGEVLEEQAYASLSAIQVDEGLLPDLIEAIRDANRNDKKLSCKKLTRCLQNLLISSRRFCRHGGSQKHKVNAP